MIPILLFPRATSKIDDVEFRRRLPNSSSGGHDDGGDDVFGGTTSFLSSKILFFHLSLDFLNLNVFSCDSSSRNANVRLSVSQSVCLSVSTSF